MRTDRFMGSLLSHWGCPSGRSATGHRVLARRATRARAPAFGRAVAQKHRAQRARGAEANVLRAGAGGRIERLVVEVEAPGDGPPTANARQPTTSDRSAGPRGIVSMCRHSRIA